MTGAPLKVLVVDDEPPIRKLLRMGLSKQGYDVLEAPTGKAALELLAEKPALVVLDLGLPDIQGLELLRMIRARNEGLPIVVLSSRGDEVGKVAALDLGADDYVTKPFGMDELLARMRAALRHQLQVHGERPVFRTGDLSVDLVRRIVKVRDKEVKLSPKEYDLLRVLVQHAGKVLTHKFLLGGAVGRSDRRAKSAGLRAPGPAEDRSRPRAAAIYPDGNRHRLSPASAGLRRPQRGASCGLRLDAAGFPPSLQKRSNPPLDAPLETRGAAKAVLQRRTATRNIASAAPRPILLQGLSSSRELAMPRVDFTSQAFFRNPAAGVETAEDSRPGR